MDDSISLISASDKIKTSEKYDFMIDMQVKNILNVRRGVKWIVIVILRASEEAADGEQGGVAAAGVGVGAEGDTICGISEIIIKAMILCFIV